MNSGKEVNGKEVPIFYSWQSTDKKTKNYIERGLKQAISEIAEDIELELAPRFDKDTQGKVGSPNISTVIEQKINTCGIFVADISLVDESRKNNKKLVNQNVMYELGYAMAKCSDEKIILLINSDYGTSLPFDIVQRRYLSFSINSDKKGEKLTSELKAVIVTHLKYLVAEREYSSMASTKEELISNMKNNKPVKLLSKKYFATMFERYTALYPGRYNGEDTDRYLATLYESYVRAKEITLELFEVLQLAAEYKSGKVFEMAFDELNILTQYYGYMKNDPPQIYDVSKDFPAMIVHDITAIIFGLLADEKMWETVAAITKVKLNKLAYSPGNVPEDYDGIYYYPKGIVAYINTRDKAKYHSPMSILFNELFGNDYEFVRVYTAGELFQLTVGEWFYFGWTFPNLLAGWDDSLPKSTPDFFTRLKDTDFVNTLVNITGKTPMDLAEHIWNIMNQDILPFEIIGHRSFSFMLRAIGINNAGEIGANN